MLLLNKADSLKGKVAEAKTTPISLQGQDYRDRSRFLSAHGHTRLYFRKRGGGRNLSKFTSVSKDTLLVQFLIVFGRTSSA